MSHNKNTIVNTLREHAAYFAREFGVRRFGLFGSFVRGDATRKSDIDLLVEFNKPIGLFRFVSLEDRLGVLLGRRVDLATPNALKQTIKKNILSQVVYV